MLHSDLLFMVDFLFFYFFLAEIQTKGEPSLNSKEYQNSD